MKNAFVCHETEKKKKMRDILGLYVGEAGIRVGSMIHENQTLPLRTILIDLESSVIDGISSLSLCEKVCGKEDAANNFARGYCTAGRHLFPVMWDTIRRVAETCDYVSGMTMISATSGGTGSGVGSLLAQNLSEEYGKVSKLGIHIIPSPQVSCTIVEPYNTTLCHHYMMEHLQTKILVDNESMYDLCGVERPNYTNLNHMVAQVATSLHQPFNEYYTNLVPYPRVHYITTAYSPCRDVGFSSSSSSFSSSLSVPTSFEMTRDVLQLRNRMVRVYGKPGKWISAYVMYEGHVTTNEVNQGLQKAKNLIRVPFVDWSPAGIKCTLHQTDKEKTKTTLLVNDTVIKESFARNNRRFNRMWNKGAFLHWYIQEGMEVDEFVEAQENMAALELDYQEMEQA